MVQCEVDLTAEQYNDEAMRTQVEEDVLQHIIKEQGKLLKAEWTVVSLRSDVNTKIHRFICHYQEARRGVF
jgi:uncharacterized protein with ATP-grasp and redox domains